MDLCEVETTHSQGLPVFNFLWICLAAKLEDLHSDWKFSRARGQKDKVAVERRLLARDQLK